MIRACRYLSLMMMPLAFTSVTQANDPEWTKPVVVSQRTGPCVTFRARVQGEWLLVEMTPQRGWHSFAIDNQRRARERLEGKKSLGLEASTKIEPVGEHLLVGPWYQPEPIDFSKPELRWFTFGFDSTAVFACKIRHATATRLGKEPVAIRVTGQACNDSSCRNIDVTIRISETQITDGVPALLQGLKPVRTAPQSDS